MKIEIDARNAWKQLRASNESLNDISIRYKLMQDANNESWKSSGPVTKVELPLPKSHYSSGTILPSGMFAKLFLEKVGDAYTSFMQIGNSSGCSFKGDVGTIQREFKNIFGDNWSSFGYGYNGVYVLDGEPVLSMQEHKTNLEIFMGGEGSVLCPFERTLFLGDMNLLSRFSTGVVNVLADYYQKRNPDNKDLRNKDITMHL